MQSKKEMRLANEMCIVGYITNDTQHVYEWTNLINCELYWWALPTGNFLKNFSLSKFSVHPICKIHIFK